VFRIGEIVLTAIHTPGHTNESMCFTITDHGYRKGTTMVFTGDTLFVGDVGRTDLSGIKRSTENGIQLYDSIFNKLLPLGDGVILYPLMVEARSAGCI